MSHFRSFSNLIPSVHNVFIVLTLASPLTTRIESLSNFGFWKPLNIR
jgi:hypothetical protein